MSGKRQLAVGIVAIALVGLYSIIMMATSGAAASWAWLILVAVVVLVAAAARSARVGSTERRGS